MPPRRVISRLKLGHIIFLALLLSGIIPLLIATFLLIGQNRERLESEERTQLTQAAESLSREINDQLAAERASLHQLGKGLLLVPGPSSVQSRLRQDWVGPYLRDFTVGDSSLQAVRVLGPGGAGPRVGPQEVLDAARDQLDAAFDSALKQDKAAYHFVLLARSNEPGVALAVPVEMEDDVEDDAERSPALVVEALVRLPVMEAVFRREAESEVGIFLVDSGGKVLWSEGVTDSAQEKIEASGMARSLAGDVPVALTTEYEIPGAGGGRRMLAQVSPVSEADWAVVVQKPAAAAFAAIDRMVFNAVAAAALLILLALLFAMVTSRWVSLPIQRLAEGSHEIAEGNFGRRMEGADLPAELSDLASDFNRMSDHVESYVVQLREAARVNRELFIGSIRAFAAAIDAKDPYTRGHSERVATLSRIIARHLSLSEETQQKVWIAALLHDVGKIGVEDRVLRKVGRLTDEEFDQMKTHTLIGAEIVSSIEQLREMIPAIRWHHESWNGRGYPDGKRGEEIPLSARIVALADTFDAITTNRPYQKAYALEEATAIITKLTGSRFDAKVVTAFFRAYEHGEVRTPDPGPAPREAAAKVSSIGVGALS